MGDPKKKKKKYAAPRRPYDKTRLDAERVLKRKYGMKNKREFWRIETILRKKRKNARRLLALPLEKRIEREKELIGSLVKLGVLGKETTLDAVLSLTIDAMLERRLQTLVWRKGLSNTVSQARQFITHGHIAVDGRRCSSPNYLIPKDKEDSIGWYKREILINEPVQAVKTEKSGKKTETAENSFEAVEKTAEKADFKQVK